MRRLARRSRWFRGYSLRPSLHRNGPRPTQSSLSSSTSQAFAATRHERNCTAQPPSRSSALAGQTSRSASMDNAETPRSARRPDRRALQLDQDDGPPESSFDDAIAQCQRPAAFHPNLADDRVLEPGQGLIYPRPIGRLRHSQHGSARFCAAHQNGMCGLFQISVLIGPLICGIWGRLPRG